MKPIVTEAWVVACEAERPRFLCRAKERYWAVTDEPGRAHPFPSQASATTARDAFVEFHSRGIYGAPGDWKPMLMSLRATFKAP
jgi:hypothetical protein